MSLVRKAIVIVAHPRSGTHITLDFIRRNFPVFNAVLHPWQSARELYVSLDWPQWCDDLRRQVRRSDHVILQSHMAGVRSSTEAQAIAYMKPDHAHFIYPFRRYSATMRSFAAYCRYPGRVESFLDEESRFFRSDSSVADCARQHAERWLERPATFVNVEAMMTDPHRAAAQLGEALGVAPAHLARRLPHRRLFQGKMAEAMERLTGRESTEVQVFYEKDWADAAEPQAVNARFEDLHAEMSARSIV